MKNESKVSVVMAVYNGEKYLREAVNSILSQTFKDFEFIIINDGSTDATREILESYRDPRIVLIHQGHVGLTKSLNKGITQAKGEYIARQDADDISLPERLENQIEFMESHKNIALLGTAAKIIDERGGYLHTRKYPGDYTSIQKVIREDNCFCHGSVMFKKKSFFDLGGYREIFSTAQDYDLWLRFTENFDVENLPTPLYIRRFNPLSITIKDIVFQRRMGTFARRLAKARERGISERSLLKERENIIDGALSLAEKRVIIARYCYAGLVLLRQNKITEAFLLMNEGVKYHPSKFYQMLFKISKVFQISFLLKMLIKLRFLFFIGKSENAQYRKNRRSSGLGEQQHGEFSNGGFY